MTYLFLFYVIVILEDIKDINLIIIYFFLLDNLFVIQANLLLNKLYIYFYFKKM